MSSPIVRSDFCDCGRRLHGNSIRMGFTACNTCRNIVKHQQRKAREVPLGRLVGEVVFNRLSTQENHRE